MSMFTDRLTVLRALRAIPGGARLAIAGVVLVAALIISVRPLVTARDGDGDSALVRRGSIAVVLRESGALKPAQSTTYRSPVSGAELEIVQLAPEGVLVQEGDLIARFDTSDLTRELGRARQAARQAAMELRVAESERES